MGVPDDQPFGSTTGRRRSTPTTATGWSPPRGAISPPAEPFDVEYRVVLPDDSVMWFHDRATLVSDRGGQALAAV